MFSTGKFQITISTLLSGGFFRGSGKEIVTISRYTKPSDDAETDLRTRKSLISGPTHRLNGGSAPLSAKIGSDPEAHGQGEARGNKKDRGEVRAAWGTQAPRRFFPRYCYICDMINFLVAILSSLLLEYVNPFVGTDFHGHTFPGATYPFGMVQLSPDTRIAPVDWDGCSGYHYSDEYIYGFSHTHLSGTGCADLGDILLMPTIGYHPENGQLDQKVYRSRFSHENEMASPGYYEVLLENTGIKVRLTVGQRCGMHEYSYPKYTSPEIIIDLDHRDRLNEWSIDTRSNGKYAVSGHRRSTSWAKGQDVYFYLEFSQPITSVEKCEVGAVLHFNRSYDNVITVKAGISSVSEANAKANLRSENPADFDQLRRKTEREWEHVLMKTPCPAEDVESNRIFYTSLYHCYIHPSLYSDVNGEYRGMDRKVHKAITPEGKPFRRYTIFSLWDTFRGLHPLLSRIEPETTVDFLRSFQSVFNEAGKLPVWELWGYETNCMIGYNSAPVIADALQAGVGALLLPIEVERLFDAMVATSDRTEYGLGSFHANGMVLADDDHESVSKTLEYAYDEWCISRVADWLLEHSELCRFHSRAKLTQLRDHYRETAQYWRNVFDPSTGFMRARLNGRFVEPFDPREVNNNYTEANSWQYSFFVPQDIAGLIGALGGPAAFEHRLDELFAAPDRTLGRNQVDITGLIGQYAHGNEPSHHIAYLYNYLGRQDKTDTMVRRIMGELYSSAPDGLCGNEDCGQMSAWYVLSAMGQYPVCPGAPDANSIGREVKPTSLPEDIVVNPAFEMDADIFLDSLSVALNPVGRDSKLWWRVGDGEFREYDGPVEMYGSASFEAYAERGDGRRSFTVRSDIHKIHTDMKVSILNSYSSQYSGGGDNALIDDVRGKLNWRTGGWQGYQGCDFEAVMDLLETRELSEVGAGFCQDQRSWIWMPVDVEFSWSVDGETFFPIATVSHDIDPQAPDIILKDFAFALEPETLTVDWAIEGEPAELETVELAPMARYIKVKARNFGTIPDWHPGAGSQAFIFVDEFWVK